MPTKYYAAPGAIHRLPGESFASFATRQKQSQVAAAPSAPKRRPAKIRSVETFETKLDDLGDSPDY